MLEKKEVKPVNPPIFFKLTKIPFLSIFHCESTMSCPFWAGTPTGCRDGTSDSRAETIPSCWNRAVDRCCPQVKRDLKREICGDVVNFPDSMGISVDLTMFAYWCFFWQMMSSQKSKQTGWDTLHTAKPTLVTVLTNRRIKASKIGDRTVKGEG